MTTIDRDPQRIGAADAPRALVLATRRSMLALAQARAYAQTVVDANAGLAIDELHVVTSGDRIQDRSLQAIGGKGLFIKEVEEALLDERADLAVHSIKDVPADLADGLRLASIPPREDPRDVIVTRSGGPLADLPQGAKVGTSSLRRKVMLLRARPDLDVGPLRGNVDTRLRKLEEGQVDAIVLAYAGLRRLAMGDRASEILEPEMSLPAVGQGALGIECREGDDDVAAALAPTSDEATRIAVAAERQFMKAVGGSCQLPVAAYCIRDGDELWLRAMLADASGDNARFAERRCAWNEDEGRRAADDLGAELRG